MADIRIKDLATTATTTASDDFMAVDGATNGTRKLNAAAPAFLTSVTTPSLTAPASIDLTLAGGSSGASLVLGAGTAAGTPTLTATGTGIVSVVGADSSGPATYAAQSRGGFRSYQDSGGTFGYNRYLDIISAQSADGTNGGGVIRLLVNSITSASVPSEVARVTKTGNLLIGTTDETGLTGAGGLKINSSTAGSSNAGALVVTGGLSAGGASYFGGAVTTTGNAAASAGLFVVNGSGSGDQRYADFGNGAGFTAFRFKRPSGANGFGLDTYDAANINLNALGGSSGAFTISDNATTRFTLSSTGAATFAGAVITSSTTLSGAGAIPITTSLVKFTSTGGAQALTLANGVDGQRLTIVHDVDGGSGVLTPTTKTGFSTVTFTNVGETVSLVYVTTRGWMVTGSYLATIAP